MRMLIAIIDSVFFFFFKKRAKCAAQMLTSLTQTHSPIVSVCSAQMEKDLCFATAEFEDFVLQFLDR